MQADVNWREFPGLGSMLTQTWPFLALGQSEFMCICPVVSGGHCCLGITIPSGSNSFPSPLPHSPLSPEGRGYYNIPLRTECSKTAHSLHMVRLEVCISSLPLQREAFLMLAEPGTDLWIWQNVIFLPCSFKRTTVFGFSLCL